MNELSASGIALLVFGWGIMFALSGFCFYKVLFSKKKKKE